MEVMVKYINITDDNLQKGAYWEYQSVYDEMDKPNKVENSNLRL